MRDTCVIRNVQTFSARRKNSNHRMVVAVLCRSEDGVASPFSGL